MPYAFVQAGGGTFSTNTITWSQATTAGNLLVVCYVQDTHAGEYVASLAGNVNTSQPGWTSAVGTINTAGCKISTGSGNGNFANATLLFLPGASNAGGDTTTVITNVNEGGGNRFIGAMEFSGLNSTSPFVGYSLNAQTNPGAGANAVTSNNVNVSSVPALLAGFGYTLDQAGITAGTGFTARGLDASDAPNYYIYGEDQRITTSGNVAATFTDAGGATDTTLAIGMAFAEVTSTAIRQACVAYSGTSTVSSESATFAEATLAGSTIYVVATGNITAVPMGFSDVVNGSYQQLTSDNITDGTASQALAAFVFPNAAAISAAQNLTVSPATSVKNLGFVAYEISGGASINQLVGHASNLQTIATNVANGIASPAINCGIGSALLVGVCMNTTANGVTYLPVTGGAFTAAPSPGAAFWPYLTLNLAAGEYQTVSGGGVNSVYFTAPTSTSNDYVTFAAAFNQLALPLLGQILM